MTTTTDKQEKLGEGHAEWLPIKELQWGAGNPYQRPLRPRMVAKIRDHFQVRSLGVFEVVNRGQGKGYWVKDGQHRAQAISEMPEHQQKCVLCHVMVSESVRDEARETVVMNRDRAGWNAYALWRADVVAQDPDALRIKSMLDRWGIAVLPPGSYQSDGRRSVLGAIATVRSLWGRQEIGPELVDRTLGLLKGAWPTETDALSNKLVMGMAGLLAAHWGEINEERVVKALQKTTAEDVIADARQLKGGRNVSMLGTVSKVLQEHYDLGQQRLRLPDTSIKAYAVAIRNLEAEMVRRRKRQERVAATAGASPAPAKR